MFSPLLGFLLGSFSIAGGRPTWHDAGEKNMDVFEEGVYHWKSFAQKWPKAEGYTPNRVPSTQSWRNDEGYLAISMENDDRP